MGVILNQPIRKVCHFKRRSSPISIYQKGYMEHGCMVNETVEFGCWFLCLC
jgi:hypothetical protein